MLIETNPLEPGQIVIGYTRMFYGSGSGVVTILNAADVADIATAEQTITWNRYNAVSVYHWGKYNIVTTTTYRNELEMIKGPEYIEDFPRERRRPSGEYYVHFFNSYTIDTRNGTFTLSGPKEIGMVKVETSVGYTDSTENTALTRDTATSNQLVIMDSYFGFDNSGYTQGTYKVASTTTQSCGSYIGDVTSENNSAYPENGILSSNWYIRGNTTYRQGTYVDQVTSRVETAYPTNGYQDGYWYVLVS